MRRKIYKAVSFILTLSLVAVCSLTIPAYSYAAGGVKQTLSEWYNAANDWCNEYGIKLLDTIPFCLGQFGALADKDFQTWMQNEESYYALWGWDHPLASYDESTQQVTFSDEFLQTLKQALKDYAKETDNSYYYVWSTGFDEISYDSIGAFKPAYDTIKNVLETIPTGAIKLNASAILYNGTYRYFIGVQPLDLSAIGFVKQQETSGYQYSYTTWQQVPTDYYCVYLQSSDTAISSWEEFKSRSFGANKAPTYYSDDYSTLYDISSTGTLRKLSVFNNETTHGRIVGIDGSWGYVVTLSRATFRMYRSSDEFFDYTLGKRHVYFTNGFWNTDPGEITASLDDLANSTDRMNDTLEKLLDKIDDNTDEKTIEELLQQILDEMKNQGSGGDTGGGTGGGSSGGSWSDGAIDGLFGYLDAILDYLDQIVYDLENLVFLEWNDQQESKYGDMKDLVDALDSDPETGSQKVADTLSASFSDVARGITKKFPFSIPWDIYHLFTVFTNVDPPQEASYRAVTVSNQVMPVTVDPEDLAQDVHDAPYFVFPLVIERYGINENLVIDLQYFTSISKLSRALFSVLFGVFLLKFTLKIVGLLKFGGGDSDD